MDWIMQTPQSMKKVLIVDDEPDIVDLVALILDDEELDVLVAYDGEQALDIVREQHPDLLLTDIMMPRLDGRELCTRLKSEPSTSDTRVILMSAMHIMDPGCCGADALIRKPFDISLVSATVEQLLSTAC